MDSTAPILQNALLYILLPIWLAAGFADYCCHRFLHIEYTAGLRESILHLALLIELGSALLVALLVEINAGAIALLFAICILHEVTAWMDLLYAASRRRIPVPEQWVHGLQQMLPWIALGGVMILHPGPTRALFGAAPGETDWALRFRPPPLPLDYLAALAAAALLLALLPFLAEYRRCKRNRSTMRFKDS